MKGGSIEQEPEHTGRPGTSPLNMRTAMAKNRNAQFQAAPLRSNDFFAAFRHALRDISRIDNQVGILDHKAVIDV
jgi:hypothetical protein